MAHDFKYGIKEKAVIETGDKILVQNQNKDIENVPSEVLSGATTDIVVDGTTYVFVNGILKSFSS